MAARMVYLHGNRFWSKVVGENPVQVRGYGCSGLALGAYLVHDVCNPVEFADESLELVPAEGVDHPFRKLGLLRRYLLDRLAPVGRRSQERGSLVRRIG